MCDRVSFSFSEAAKCLNIVDVSALLALQRRQFPLISDARKEEVADEVNDHTKTAALRIIRAMTDLR